MEWESFTYGAFLAIVVTSGAIAAVFAAITRRQFLLWAAARVGAIGILAITFAPESLAIFDTKADMVMVRLIALDLMLATAGPLLATYIEPDIELPQTRKALWLLLPLGFILIAIAPVVAYQDRLGWLHDGIGAGALLVLAVCMARAIRAGSRAATYQAFAWAPALIIAYFAILYAYVLDSAISNFPLLFMVSLTIDFLFSAAGVGDSFMIVQRERDAAVANMLRANKAGALDPLTGIANRRGLERQFKEGEGPRPKGLAVIDCDHFKRINDTFGHDVGDDVLVAVAQALKGDGLFPARMGGEEFVLLAYGNDWEADLEAARRRIPETVLSQVPTLEFETTASSGVASISPDENMAESIRRADRALYRAKHAGRDRSVRAKDASGPLVEKPQARLNVVQ